MVVVYIPPSAVAASASDVIHSVIAGLQMQHPSALIVISGDFNHVSLSPVLTNFTQYVDCATRGNKILDLLYANVKNGYISSSLPPLGDSDHNLIHLDTTYRPMVEQQAASTRTVKVWSNDTEEALQECFNVTDWGLFIEDFGDDIEGLSRCITDYIKFCEDSIVPTKKVRCFSNNKPWINKDIKGLLNRKKRAFMSKDHEELRAVQKELKRKLREAKNSYKEKIEAKMGQNNTKEVWNEMKKMTGCGKATPGVKGGPEFATELNLFFNRFNTTTPLVSSDCRSESPSTITAPIRTSAVDSAPLPSNDLSPSTSPCSSAAPADSPPSLHCPPSPHSPLSLCSPPSTHCPIPTDADLPTTHSLTLTSSQDIRESSGLRQNQASGPPLFLQPTTHGLTLTSSQVQREFSRLRRNKASGPDNISPRVLRACAGQLAGVFQHLFSLSLRLRKVPDLWKTSCIIPVPKKGRPSTLNDYRPVALTSHVMKSFERLVLQHLRPLLSAFLDPLQFAYQQHIGVEDAIIFLTHKTLSHLESAGSTVRVTFFDFSSAFNSIQPSLLRDKLLDMQLHPDITAWILDYLTGRPQYVRVDDCVSEVASSNTGVPQGTVLAPFLFTLYTSDFRFNSGSCHLQKFSDDSSIVGCISNDDEEEYRGLIESFVAWSNRNHLKLNISKTKEVVVDYRRNRRQPAPVIIQGEEVEMVDSYKYLGVHINNKLDWTHNTDALYRKGQSRMFFLRRLRSFGVCSRLLKTFYQSMVASALFFAVVCWWGGVKTGEANRLNKLVRKARSVVGLDLDSLETVAERRVKDKICAILDNPSHPLHDELWLMGSSFSQRIIPPRCKTERFRRSFVPTAIRLYNSSLA